MSLYLKKYGRNYSKFHLKCIYTFDFIKFTTKTLFYVINFNLTGSIYHFKRDQSLKYQRFNKYNRKSSRGSCPKPLYYRSVAGSVDVTSV